MKCLQKSSSAPKKHSATKKVVRSEEDETSDEDSDESSEEESDDDDDDSDKEVIDVKTKKKIQTSKTKRTPTNKNQTSNIDLLLELDSCEFYQLFRWMLETLAEPVC